MAGESTRSLAANGVYPYSSWEIVPERGCVARAASGTGFVARAGLATCLRVALLYHDRAIMVNLHTSKHMRLVHNAGSFW